METRTDHVTGLRLELTTTLALAPATLWEIITDVTGIGTWSPECRRATWVDGASEALPGARFAAQNRFGDDVHGITLDAVGVVAEVAPPSAFAWTMLDDDGTVGSIWRYELTATTGGTLVRHSFEHGPGMTGMREGARRNPASIARRLGELAGNMSATLWAMEQHVFEEVA